MKNDDAKLIQRVLAGDDTAFSVLVNKYQKPVHALAWRKIGDFHVAEEITQDTFLKAYQRLSTLKEPQRFVSWLYVIATNHCNAWLRKKRLRTEPLEDTSSEALEKATYSGYVIQENERTAVEAQREVVKQLLAKLQESERTVITLHYFSEMSSAEIGAFLGVSANTIRSRLRRAQERLKREEPMIRDALEHFQITPHLTDNIMREISRMKPTPPSGGKPLVPWAIAVSTLAVIFLMFGIGNQQLSRFQRPYSFDATSEMMVEIIEAPIVLNLEAKPDIRTQVGNVNTPSERDTFNQQPNNVSASVADAQSDETAKDYSQWELPKAAKARFGKGGINAMQFSPDGTQLAVGSDVGVWLYDVATGEEQSLFRGACRYLAFSPDGRFLVNGGERSDVGKIQLWEIATGREVLFPEVYDTASALRFSSDGKMLVSVGSGGWALISLDIETGKLTEKPFFRRDPVGAFGSEDGVYAITRDKVAGGRKDGKIQLWDVVNHKALTTLRGHTDLPLQPLDQPLRRRPQLQNEVLAVTFSPDGTRLASGSIDKTVRLWDLTDKDKWTTLQKHTGWINVLAFSPNGKMLASGSTDKTIQLWDPATGESLRTLTGHPSGITALAFAPDGTTLASGSADGMIRFWDTQTGDTMADRITGHTHSMEAVTFLEDGSTLAGVAFNGVITFWDVKTWQKSNIQAAGQQDWFPTLALSPDGTKLVSVVGEGTKVFGPEHSSSTWRPDHLIRLTDVKTGRELATLPYRRGVKELTFSPDGETVAFSGLGEIRLWNTRTGDEQEIPLADLSAGILHNIPRVVALAFSPHGTWLVSGTQGGKIQMWDVATGSALTVIAEPTEQENLGRISALAFSPDGALLAAGTRDHIQLWAVDTVDKLFSINTDYTRGLMTFGGSAAPLVFSPDGAVLLNGLSHGAIQLWDVTTGDGITVLDGHTQRAQTLAFSPDGKTLVSTGMDGTILLWDWNEVLAGSNKSE
ncbi:sigma-70 family RNA polymerase sigma factor [Candidatus Poribacteria bacterium]|nr:sigma-70 family RNA polymerase sigma factor [Candidatus Poribacteria bacterium]